MNINDQLEYIQIRVRQAFGLGHDEVAACAAVHARTVIVQELEEDYQDRFAAYATRLDVALNLPNQDAANAMLLDLLKDLRREAGQ